MPAASRWNGRFLATGGGGNSGAIIYSRLVDGLERNYAVLSTDNGHVGKTSIDQSWAIGHPEKVIDFGHRAQAVVAVVGKAVVREFYRQPAAKSYWKRFYSPITRSDGTEVFPGFPKGAEVTSAWLGRDKPTGANWAGFWSDVVYENPQYDVLSRLDVTGFSDYDRAKAKVSRSYDALDPNLEPFASRGGKLIVWHGWHDELVSALRTETYVKDVSARVGAARADSFMRTYFAPGVNHCRGGVGPIPDEYNLLEKVVDWVENGRAPGGVIGTHRNERGEVDRTMPVCPYPQFARYKGTGDVKDAANFVCAAP